MSLSRPARADKIGDYTVLEAIGAGGSARIDLARIDRAYGFQRHVVIKRPLEHLRADPGVAASLRREAEIGGRLRHPNLVAVLDAGVHDGYDYLVLELVHGGSLRALMQVERAGAVRAVPLSAALTLVVDAARGLHEAHELCGADGQPLGLVHRDVSPSNILLGLDGTVKLSDFGIAKDTRVTTLSGSMRGTVTYMAPEQCRGHAFDRRADVFSLGVILYELCTGTRLFYADNDVASLHRVLSGAVPRPREVNPAIAAELEALILRALAHDPAQRLGSMKRLADGLEAFAAGAGIPIGARFIAQAMDASLGPRPVPWIAATTVPDAVAAEPPLVTVIQNAPADEPAVVTFGDARDRVIDEPATPVTRPPVRADTDAAPVADAPPPAPRRRGARLAVIALAAGAALVAIAMVAGRTSPDAPARDTAPAAPEPATPEPAAAAPAPADDAAPDLDADPDLEIAPAPAPAPAVRPAAPPRKHRHGSSRHAATAPATAVPAAPHAGSAAASTPPAKVEWKPTIMLPSDHGSGSSK